MENNEGKAMLTSTWPKSNAKWPTRLLAICLVLVLISCIGASALQTSFGNVQVTSFKIPSSNGEWITGELFKPATASTDNKVPMVVTAHGYLNNSEMQDSTAIELSRRGIAVISFDLLYHGESSSAAGGVMGDLASSAMGMIPMVEYAYNNLDYVDKTKIGVMGHSAGGACAEMTLMYYGAQYLGALKAAQAPDSDGGSTITQKEQDAANALNKVSAGFITSFASMVSPETMMPIQANAGLNYSRYDEGGYSTKRGNADISGNSDISLAFINSIMPEGQKVNSVEIGKYYGDASNKTLRVVYNPDEVHIWMPFSTVSTGYAVDFFTQSFQMANPIPTTNQIWNWKEFFNCIGLAASFMIILPLALLLLKLPAFASIRGSIPQELPALKQNKKAALFFWVSWAISWIVSALSFIPITNLDQVFAPAGAKMMVIGSVFAQPATNFIVIWAIFNGLVGLLLFWISYKFVAKKSGFTIETLGIKTNGKELLKTLGLTACIFIGFYALLAFAEFFFTADFRFWLIAVTPFNSNSLLMALPYMLLFFVYFLASSMMLNSSMRVAGQKHWVNLLIGAVGSVLGLLIVILLQYGTDFSTGAIFFKDLPTDWLHIVVAIPLVVLLFVSNYISRYLFKATGKVWLGAMVNTMIMVMIFVANTATLSTF